jgi:deferrochelatase/peroxidase EfeB
VKQTLSTITVLVPLREDAAPDVVAQRLDALGDGAASPFAASERTHFARLVVLPADLPRLPRPQRMRFAYRVLDLVTHLGRRQRTDRLWRPYLVFSAGYDLPDGDGESAVHAYALHLHRRLGGRADEIWGACEGYPGMRDGAAFARFISEHTLPARYTFTPKEGADVAGIRAALRLREQVVELAMSTAGGTPAQLRERFIATFWGARRPAARGEPLTPAAPVTAPGTATGTATAAPPAAGPVPVQRALGAAPADEDAEWNGWVRRDALAWPDLPRMRSANRVDLDDVQGLTVGYPGHEVAAFVVLRVTHAERARQWLARVRVTTATEAHRIIDAAKPGAGPGALPEPFSGPEPPDVAVHVAVSHTGLAALGVAPERRAGFDRSFRAGMAVRERALAPGVGTGPWRTPFLPPAARPDGGVHLLLHLSAPSAERLRPRLAAAVAGIEASGAFAEPWVQHAGRIPDPAGNGSGDTLVPGERRRFVEHFGFVDGISQPSFQGVSRAGRGRSAGDLPAGELLLGHDDVDGDTAGATAPPDLARNGSYLVLRKLEQDVPAFRALVRDATARYPRAAVRDAGEVAAKLVGRRRGGTSLAAPPEAEGPDALRLDFADDPDGRQCPVGAHVRRVNPRDSRPLDAESSNGSGNGSGNGGANGGANGEEDQVEERLVRRHLMLRRGIPYGPYLPETGAGNGPDGDGEERGLLFLALVADIGRQFEFVQTQWMGDGSALRLGTDRDVFSGAAGAGKFTIQGEPPVFVPTPRAVVTCRGGEYFLLPGVAALRALASPPAG